MTPTVDLSRSELGRLADVLELLSRRHGSARKAADAMGIAHDITSKILGRPAALKVTPATLATIAAAAGAALGLVVTAEELRRGALHLPPPPPPASGVRSAFASTTKGALQVRARMAR